MSSVHLVVLQNGLPPSAPGKIIILPNPSSTYTLRLLIPGTDPVSRNATVKTNHPPEGESFDRDTYHDFPTSQGIDTLSDQFVNIPITSSGTFSVYIEYSSFSGFGDKHHECQKTTEKWHFIVRSHFEVKGKAVYPDGLSVQTVLPKLMGPYATWGPKLEAIAQKNYNAVHFVPLQKRGESDSPFSIYDQLDWDEANFPNGEKDVESLVNEMRNNYGLLPISDLVLNHTASNSDWLKDHPEVGYSKETEPHLESAVELENAMLKFSKELHEQGQQIATFEDVQKVMADFEEKVIAEIRLWEYYVLDVPTLSRVAEKLPFHGKPSKSIPVTLTEAANMLADKGGVHFNELQHRYFRTVDTDLLAEYVAGSKLSAKELLDEINIRFYDEYDNDVKSILSSVQGRLCYLRLDAHGPHLGAEVSENCPIHEPYFTTVQCRDGTEAKLANNGWVWAGDAMVDFAGPKSKAYLTRSVIIWGDCVKLRYGSSRDDCPYLWDRMGEYAQLLAKHFDGLRIDNAHSTPLAVGQYMIDKARAIRPNLFICAELFTGSEYLDKLYVECMGITALLREAIQPDTAKDLSTTININGGLPIGSFMPKESYKNEEIELVRLSSIPSLLMEMTHDNESFAEKRTVNDTLSTAGLVAMSQASSGTAVGGDECYPSALNVVSESRLYKFGNGIGDAKKVLNELHAEMSESGMYESYTDHQGQYISVHRLNPVTGRGIYLIARTAFEEAPGDQDMADTFLEKTEVEWYHGWYLTKEETAGGENDPNEIEPIPVKLHNFQDIKIVAEGSNSHIVYPKSCDFLPGSVMIFRTKRNYDLTDLENLVCQSHDDAVQNLDLLDMNILLYRTEGEERCASEGSLGTYQVPDHGNLVYAGLQGWVTPLKEIVKNNDLGHPICANLRQGLWAFDSILTRLKLYHESHPNLSSTIQWLAARIEAAHSLPSFLRPKYFAAIVLGLYDAAVHRASFELLPEELSTSDFVRRLALTSIQMVANIPNASLTPNEQVPSMAAGLPHFSEGIMRCWGRDVFLSVRGLLLETCRYKEAEEHILFFAATLKHGLIPNLLDSGRNPRYNARDAVWFFLQSIQDYCKHTGSLEILNKPVKRRFPLDDTFVEWDSEEAFSYSSTLAEIFYEVLARHAAGIEFREHNAGPDIDSQMTDNGFNQKIWVDWSNGLVFGGNQDNCGTWMDKMGESTTAGNKGVPGTPRDGAAVEISGLLKSALNWASTTLQNELPTFPDYVVNQNGDQVLLSDWNKLVHEKFEFCYYVPRSQAQDPQYDVDSMIVNRRGIYKDLYRSGKAFEDYQLRPNLAIAMVVAPELFDLDKGLGALHAMDQFLRGPCGMATLDPSDYNYRPNYENSVDNDDFATSKGRNYHQGPEWLWCTGVFLQALIMFQSRKNKHACSAMLRDRVQDLRQWLLSSPWAGLTELTNKNGAFCSDSSPTQAWSSARLLETIAVLAKITKD